MTDQTTTTGTDAQRLGRWFYLSGSKLREAAAVEASEAILAAMPTIDRATLIDRIYRAGLTQSKAGAEVAADSLLALRTIAPGPTEPEPERAPEPAPEPEPVVTGDILVRLPRADLVTIIQALEEVRQTGPARLASAAFTAIMAIDEAEAYVEQMERETEALRQSAGVPEPERSPDGCVVCGRDIDRLGGNPDCETCAAEPSEMDRLLGDLAGILSEQDSGRSWSQPETLELVDAISLAISEAVLRHDAAARTSAGAA